jgi:hypothetical protein
MLGPMQRPGPAALAAEHAPCLPAYGDHSLADLVPALLDRARHLAEGTLPAFLAAPVAAASQVVLLVLDGLGEQQLAERPALAPVLSALDGSPLTSVAPSTTASALTSLATGATPAEHGVLGYRLRAAAGVLNVLRWTLDGADARGLVPPHGFCRRPPFLGRRPPVVARAEFAGTGFTEAYLPGADLRGWRVPSSIAVEVRRALAEGVPLVYAYYDGVDKIAHETGLGEHYDAELAAVDRLVGDLLDLLPPGAALVVTADHGQVEVRDEPVRLAPDLLDAVGLLSGEGRFRWLHVPPGAVDDVVAACREAYGHLAWVRTREEVVAEGWLGGRPADDLFERIGDVALAARAPVAFFDPADTGELRLVARHGSLTPAEMLVPLRAAVR